MLNKSHATSVTYGATGLQNRGGDAKDEVNAEERRINSRLGVKRFPATRISVHRLWSIVKEWGRLTHPKIPASTKFPIMLSISIIIESIDKSMEIPIMKA